MNGGSAEKGGEMNSDVAGLVLAALLVVLGVGQILYWRRPRARKPTAGRSVASGALLLLAAFCAYGFLAAGEQRGRQETAWRTGYALCGGL